MIEIQDYIRKLHEQTGVKLKEDDPILIELIAQQIILEEFSNELEAMLNKIENDHLCSLQSIKNKNIISFNKSIKEIKESIQKQKTQLQKNIEIIKKRNELLFYSLIAINFILNIIILYQIVN